MGRLTRKQRAQSVWPRFVKQREGKSFLEMEDSIRRFKQANGEFPLLCYLNLFQIAKSDWQKNTYIGYRNELWYAVRRTLGQGAAEELQRISNKRTF